MKWLEALNHLTCTCTLKVFVSNISRESFSRQLDHDHFLLHSLRYIMHFHAVIRRHVAYFTDFIVTYITVTNFHTAQQHLVDQGFLIIEVSRPHSGTPRSGTPHSAVFLSTNDHSYAENVLDNIQHSKDRHPCPRRDSKPQSQQAGGRRTP
jgi:hypothetical protein